MKRIKLSLRNRFLIPMLALIVLGMGLSTAITFYLSRNALGEAITGQITMQANSLVKQVGAWIMDRRMDIGTWSKTDLYQAAVKDAAGAPDARNSANTKLADLKKDYPFYENICVATLNGDLIAAADPAVIGKVNVKDRDYFKASLGGAVFVSDVYESRGTKNPIFVVSAPIKENQKIEGIFFGVIDLNAFSKEFVVPIKIGTSGYAYIYRKDGILIAHPDPKQILKLSMTEFDFGKKMMAQGEGTIRYTWKGVEKLVVFKKYKELDWTVGLGAGTAEVFEPITRLSYINIAVALVVVLFAAVAILLIVQSIVKPVNRFINDLNEGAEQVSAGSRQVSTLSQTLSEGASEQAASIEETSSSMEEMSSMTHQNADNARQADALMKEAGGIVSHANEAIEKLSSSMTEISKSSEETSKIVKTIDEIAFQTNLLALNAAVEAARAGEAGAGFAVVADEVRNLAMRAAQAAKNTAELIEGTVKRVKEGSDATGSAKEAFTRVAESAGKVGELVAEISTASSEQAEGIEQVNKAVAEMDKVTQMNAANAEQAAAASEELNAQADQMKTVVDELMGLISGKAV
ncbi:MAG: methyl-accepting chemotaxis protein [Pseudomonadota bacterium]